MLLSNNGYSVSVSVSVSLSLSLRVSLSISLSLSPCVSVYLSLSPPLSLLLLLVYGPVVFAINVGQCQSVKLSFSLSGCLLVTARNCYRKLVLNLACSKTNRNHWCQNNADIHQRDCHGSLSVTPVIMSTFLRANWTGSLIVWHCLFPLLQTVPQ